MTEMTVHMRRHPTQQAVPGRRGNAEALGTGNEGTEGEEGAARYGYYQNNPILTRLPRKQNFSLNLIFTIIM